MDMDADTTLLVSRCLSYSVIALSFCMKLPQISALYRAKTSKGINVRGYWMELSCYLIGSSFGYFLEFHFTTYAESILLGIQGTIIIFMAMYYGRQWNIENAVWTVALSLFVACSIMKLIPEPILRILLTCTLPLSTISKLVQVWELYTLKTQGDVSAVTWGLAGYGCAARLFTIAVEVKDIQVFINFLIALVLNTVVVLQCLYYGQGHLRKTI